MLFIIVGVIVVFGGQKIHDLINSDHSFLSKVQLYLNCMGYIKDASLLHLIFGDYLDEKLTNIFHIGLHIHFITFVCWYGALSTLFF